MIKKIIEAKGIQLKEKTAKEWAGPCPFCGGVDRFCVWPSDNKYWCRGCNKKGDAIQLLRDLEGMSYREACEALGRPLKNNNPKPVNTGKSEI